MSVQVLDTHPAISVLKSCCYLFSRMCQFFYAISFIGILSIPEQKLARFSEALHIIYDLKLWFAEDLFLHYEDSFFQYVDE